jgi:hypothetical protein
MLAKVEDIFGQQVPAASSPPLPRPCTPHNHAPHRARPQVVDDRKVRATIAAFRAHVPNPQPADMAQLVAVLGEQPRRQHAPRRRRGSASSCRSRAAADGPAAAPAARSPSLPALGERRSAAASAPPGAFARQCGQKLKGGGG